MRADLVVTAIFDPTVFGRHYFASRKELGFSTWNVLGGYLGMGHVLGHNLGAKTPISTRHTNTAICFPVATR